MTYQTKYVLDANVFINAHRQFYPFDIFPVFWRFLIDQARNGQIISIDRVLIEIEKGSSDQLRKWAVADFKPWFMVTDDLEIFWTYAEIMEWTESQNQFTGSAKTVFADGADAWLIAYAKQIIAL